MAKRAIFLSLEAFKLTGVQVTDHKLGTGSAAIVVELDYMGHKCAGKKIHEILLRNDRGSDYHNAAHRFSKECHFLSGIQHPNIVQFLGVYFQEAEPPAYETPILVMEYLPINLRSCIDNHGILPEGISCSILLDIAQGLLFLHDRISPIIHRDLSSNNVLLSPVLTAKLADLGVARIVNMSPLQVSTLTQNPGTLIYMPPEVMVDDPHYNTEIDRFSFGILMIEIFCGLPPRPQLAPTRSESGRLIGVSEADRHRKYLKIIGYDHPLMNLTLKCIENDPKLRPPAKELVEQMKEKVNESQPSFNDKLKILKFIAEREANKRTLERKQILELQKKSSDKRRNTVCTPVSLLLVVIAASVSVIFQIFNTAYVQEATLEMLGKEAQYFVNTTFSECSIHDKIKCDVLVPTIIHDLVGNISWKNIKTLQTTLYQGQSVVIEDKVYYGGGFADDEVHKYLVYCYHMQLNSWTRLATLPVKSFGLGKFNGSVVAIGGISMEGEESKKVYTYDETDETWKSVIPDMPISRQFPAIMSLSSALVVAGGEKSIGIYTLE